jgi:hypothetical protein
LMKGSNGGAITWSIKCCCTGETHSV